MPQSSRGWCSSASVAPMEFQTKSGTVYLQPHKAGKKWKPVWLSLFPPSSSGIGRLEIQDLPGGGAGGDTGTRRHHLAHGDRKVLRLSQLISVLRLPPNAEACPRENMSAFCVETHERTMVFAAPKDECVDWVEKLCQSTFQRGVASHSAQPHMEENQIYASAEEVQASEFWVVAQRTAAATRCGLEGSYRLQVGPEALQLRDPQKNDAVREWPYELLRRYGKDGLTLTIEAGRRCDSGPGTFVFETQQAEKIFSKIQSTIKRKTSNVALSTQSQEGEKVLVANRAESPLAQTPDVTGANSVLENKAKTQGRKCASMEGDLTDQSESVLLHPAPITLMPLPSVPTLTSPLVSPLSYPSDVIYADPAECLQSAPGASPSVTIYVDPASVLPLKPPGSKDAVTPTPNTAAPHPVFSIDHANSGYSEVYDQIRPVQNNQAGNKRTNKAEDEPIYTVPINEKKAMSHRNDTDPFAHLYARVCKTTQAPGPATSSNSSCTTSAAAATANVTEDTSECLGDTIYESLGVI